MNWIRLVTLLTLSGILAPRSVGAQPNRAPGASAPDDAAREMKALLSSPDAVAVARLQCATLKPDCPGGAWGLPQLQCFVGSGFAAHREPKPGTDSTSGMDFTQKYSSRLTYGINIPVLSALKKMSSAAKGDGGGKQK
jgi:hypothetical protein